MLPRLKTYDPDKTQTPKAHIVLNIAHLFAGEIVYDGVDRTAGLRALEEGKKREKQKVTWSNKE